jgi:hypothetical protein
VCERESEREKERGFRWRRWNRRCRWNRRSSQRWTWVPVWGQLVKRWRRWKRRCRWNRRSSQRWTWVPVWGRLVKGKEVEEEGEPEGKLRLGFQCGNGGGGCGRGVGSRGALGFLCVDDQKIEIRVGWRMRRWNNSAGKRSRPVGRRVLGRGYICFLCDEGQKKLTESLSLSLFGSLSLHF